MGRDVTKFLHLAGASATWPRAAVFDCDGLLVDTGACWRQAFEFALARHGRKLDTRAWRELSGASVRVAAHRLDIAPEVVRSELEAAFARERIRLMPGAAALLDQLTGRMHLGVATNGPRSLVASALRRVKVLDLFEAVVSAEDEARDKPAPDVYLAACARLGVDPSDTIAFEDSSVGVQSAQRAGLAVVFVPSGPGDDISADLRVMRLDDSRLFGFLRLDGARGKTVIHSATNPGHDPPIGTTTPRN